MACAGAKQGLDLSATQGLHQELLAASLPTGLGKGALLFRGLRVRMICASGTSTACKVRSRSTAASFALQGPMWQNAAAHADVLCSLDNMVTCVSEWCR